MTNSFVHFLGEFEDTKKSFWNYLTLLSSLNLRAITYHLQMETLKLYLLYCTAEEQSLFPWGKKRNCEMRNQSNYLTTLSLSRFLYNLAACKWYVCHNLRTPHLSTLSQDYYGKTIDYIGIFSKCNLSCNSIRILRIYSFIFIDCKWSQNHVNYDTLVGVNSMIAEFMNLKCPVTDSC